MGERGERGERGVSGGLVACVTTLVVLSVWRGWRIGWRTGDDGFGKRARQTRRKGRGESGMVDVGK